MLSRTTLRLAAPLALWLLAACCPVLARAEEPPEEEKAIRAADEAFVRDYNKGDSRALAAMFTEDAEVVEAEGGRFRGRNRIEQDFATTFAAGKGAKIVLEIGTIRFLNADAAQEEGRTRVTTAEGAPVSRRYTVLYVKRDGRWLIAGVREEPDPTARPHERLEGLAWMIGDWIDEAAESVARIHCGWSEDGNYLMRAFTVKRRGETVLTVTQRIGWDPLARQVRSWEFDSEGGFGEGRWSRDGERWIVKHTAVRPEGATASATNIMARVSPERIRWVSTDRVVGDESVPDDDPYVLVRVPPAAGPRSQGSSASPLSPITTRSPR